MRLQILLNVMGCVMGTLSLKHTLSLSPLFGCLTATDAGGGVVGVVSFTGGGALTDGPGMGGASG